MQITRQADYAVRAVLFLTNLDGDERVATSAIAEKQGIPPSFLAKIISQLSIAGLLHTSRGARGGVMLARDAKDITLLDVVEAIDGPIQINDCADVAAACVFSDGCPMKPVWCGAQAELVKRLKGINFSDMKAKR